jgi:WD40 repeat protein
MRNEGVFLHLTFALCTLHFAFCISSLAPGAVDVTPAKHPLVLPVNVPGRPAGSVECTVSVGPTVPVTALAFSPDGKTLAVGGYEEVLFWDLAGAKLARRIAAGGQVGAVLFLKDGKTLVVGGGMPGRSGFVRFLDLDSGKETFRSDEPKDLVGSLALSPDGKLLAASGAYKLVHVWNVEQKKLATTIRDHGDWVLHVSFSRDGKYLTTTGTDNTAQVWNVADWKSVVKFTETQAVRGSAFHPDAVQVLLAMGGPNTSGLRFRRTDNPAQRRPIGIGPAIPLGMVGPTKANRVYVPCSDNTVKVFNMANGGLVATLAGHQDWVESVALSPDETKLASGSADGTVKLWSSQDNRLLATLVQLAPRADEWLIVSAQGHFATSSPGALAWKAEKASTPLDPLTAGLQSPESVAKAMAGEKVAPPAKAKAPAKVKSPAKSQPPAKENAPAKETAPAKVKSAVK